MQFIADIRFIKGIDNVSGKIISRGINALLLDSCMKYQLFVEEYAKNLQMQQLLRDNSMSLKFSKIRVPYTDLVVRDTSNRRLHLFIPYPLRRTFFFMHGLIHPGANASIRLVTDKFVGLRRKYNIGLGSRTFVPCQSRKTYPYTTRLLPISWGVDCMELSPDTPLTWRTFQ